MWASEHFAFDRQRAVTGNRKRVSNYDDLAHLSWKAVSINGPDAGAYRISANRYTWTPTIRVQIEDGKLTVRITLQGDAVADPSERLFTRTDF